MLMPIKVKNQPTSMAWDGLDPGLGHDRPRRSQQGNGCLLRRSTWRAVSSAAAHCSPVTWDLGPHAFTFMSVWLLYEQVGRGGGTRPFSAANPETALVNSKWHLPTKSMSLGPWWPARVPD